MTAPGLLRATLEVAEGAVQPWRWGGERDGEEATSSAEEEPSDR